MLIHLATERAASALLETTASQHVVHAMLGLPEMLVIFGIIIVLFGATKLPQLGKGMGEAIGAFKKAQRASMQDDDREEVDGTPKLRADDDSVNGSFEKDSA